MPACSLLARHSATFEGAVSPRPSHASAQAARAGSIDAQAAKNKVCRGVQGSRRAHQPIASVGSVRNLKRHLSTPPASARRWRGGGIFPAIRHRVAARCHAPPGAFLDRDAAIETVQKGGVYFPLRIFSSGGQCGATPLPIAGCGAHTAGSQHITVASGDRYGRYLTIYRPTGGIVKAGPWGVNWQRWCTQSPICNL